MNSDTNDFEDDVRDGLHNAQAPIPRDVDQGSEGSDEASGTKLGVNEAAGPAEEQDKEDDDDRDLTTDISPSD
ncbi:hypothetical protein GC088_13815 [Arthrobacter sp. JZ12]|uniref:hypothetical protein n=1 Tax=Arthrobacter sp. JZ12 TaxID=2654190 RepID=UPI002B459F83|nr:hypothetical protein [Arthrobacter sp. JZ12]WRH26036.1 hypothetical protein GC088_13815 [Arthrobacter sp. JZ12]